MILPKAKLICEGMSGMENSLVRNSQSESEFFLYVYQSVPLKNCFAILNWITVPYIWSVCVITMNRTLQR